MFLSVLSALQQQHMNFTKLSYKAITKQEEYLRRMSFIKKTGLIIMILGCIQNLMRNLLEIV